jgi:hypothetical protein
MSTAEMEKSNRERTAGRLTTGQEMHPLEDLRCYVTRYAQARPVTLAWICLAAGFVLGWKLKPW